MYENEYQPYKLGIVEFKEVFFDNLSRLITNQEHIDSNLDFYESFIFKAYEKYANSKTENYSINMIINIFEIALDAMFKDTPSVILPDDKITIF